MKLRMVDIFSILVTVGVLDVTANFQFWGNFSFSEKNRNLKIFFGHVFSIDNYRVFKSMYLAFLKNFRTYPKNEKSPWHLVHPMTKLG